MYQYVDLIETVLKKGKKKEDRTGVGTISHFGHQMRFSLETFPIVTIKKIHFKSVVHELLWFIAGDTNTKYLKDNGVGIWDEWADENGDLGPVYGKQWRSWGSAKIDQLAAVMSDIKSNPDSRRLIVTAWNPEDVPKAALPPCHCLFQFYVRDGELSCHLYQRSADAFLGVPFNISSYALLTCMVAKVCGLKPKDFVHSFGDVHLYSDHVALAEEMIARPPYLLPTLKLADRQSIFDFKYEDVELLGYLHHPAIQAKVAV